MFLSPLESQTNKATTFRRKNKTKQKLFLREISPKYEIILVATNTEFYERLDL